MVHTVEDRQEKERSIVKNFRLAVHYLELKDFDQAYHHAEIARQDMKLIKLERMEAASAVSGIGE